MPTYKLYYFPVRARAEIARLIFAYAKVPYEDIRLGGEKWEEFKPKTPTGQMPVLEVDGVMFNQSEAINHYLAEIHGLNGKSAMDRFLINIFTGNTSDVVKGWPFGEKDEEIKAKKQKEVMEIAAKFLKKTEEEYVKRTGGEGFYLASGISMADLSILCFADLINVFSPETMDTVPKLKDLVQRVANIPELKEWIEKRPKSEI